MAESGVDDLWRGVVDVHDDDVVIRRMLLRAKRSAKRNGKFTAIRL